MALTVVNASRSSHGKLISLIKHLTCGKIGGVIKDNQNGKTPCYPFITVGRYAYERDGWQRAEYYDEDLSAVTYETDVYYTYRVRCQGDDAENIMLDLQQMFLRSDVSNMVKDIVGGSLIRTTDVRYSSTLLTSEFIDMAVMDIRLGFVDRTAEQAIDETDCTLDGSAPIDRVQGDGSLPDGINDPDPYTLVFDTEQNP